MELRSQKRLMVFSGSANEPLAEEVAHIHYTESVRGADAFVIQSHTAPINFNIMEQLIMIDALRRASTKRITAVVPFYGYARQDKKGRPREPISARLMGDMFISAGADRIVSLDAVRPPHSASSFLRVSVEDDRGSHNDGLSGLGQGQIGVAVRLTPRREGRIRAQATIDRRSERIINTVGRRRCEGPTLHHRGRHDRHRRDSGRGRRLADATRGPVGESPGDPRSSVASGGPADQGCSDR